MPTPAINIDALEEYDAPVYGYNRKGNIVYTGVTSVNSRRFWHRKPASTSTPPVKFAPRQMTRWDHLLVDIRQNMSSVSLVRKDPVPDDIQVYRYEIPQGGLYYRPCHFTTPPSVPDWCYDKAVNKMLHNLQDQKVDLGVFFAEAREAIETVTSTATRIASEVRRFRSKNPKAWSQVIKTERGGNLSRLRRDWLIRNKRYRSRIEEIPSQWLALQYGWNPLLQDVNGALGITDYTLTNGGATVRAEGHAGTTVNAVTNTTEAIPIPGFSLETTSKWKASFKLVCYYKLRNAGLATLSQLGLINPALIAWEKVPYSFVVDWFVPVGSWLNSLTAAAGYDFVTGCSTSRVVAISAAQRGRFSGFYSNFYSVEGSLEPGFSTFKGRRAYREILTASPVPGLYVKSPLSTVHMANALALLRNAFR